MLKNRNFAFLKFEILHFVLGVSCLKLEIVCLNFKTAHEMWRLVKC